jgi:hypothetical protein
LARESVIRGGTFFRWCFQCATLAIEWESQVFSLLYYVLCVGV